MRQRRYRSSRDYLLGFAQTRDHPGAGFLRRGRGRGVILLLPGRCHACERSVFIFSYARSASSYRDRDPHRIVIVIVMILEHQRGEQYRTIWHEFTGTEGADRPIT